MKTVLIIVLLFSITFAQKQFCSRVGVSNLIAESAVRLRALDDVYANIDAPTVANQILESFLSVPVLSACLNQAQSFLGASTPQSQTYISDQCESTPDSPAFAADPCCNSTLAKDFCCAARQVTVTQRVLTSFNTTAINAQCRNPDKVRAMVDFFTKTFITPDGKLLKQTVCNTQARTSLVPILRAQSVIDRCGRGLALYIPCETNRDCLSNSCNAFGYCDVYSLDSSPMAFVQCALDGMSPAIARSIQEYFNVSSPVTNATLIANAMRTNYFRDQCLDSFTRSEVQSETTQASCESTTVCTDPSITNLAQCNGNFCGSGCSNFDGRCQYSISATQSECSQFGVCRTRDAQGNDLWDYTVNATTCASRGMICTAKSCYPNCNQQKCVNTGTCLGWPFPEGNNACVRGYTFDSSSQDTRCVSGQVDVNVGCAVDIGNSTTCSGGSFVAYPTTRAACEDITICIDVVDGSITKRNRAECNKCSGQVEPLFRWSPGRFIASQFIPTTRWLPRTSVTTKKWIRSADVNAIGNQLWRATYSNTLQTFKSFVECSAEPLAAFLEKIACDCGNDSIAGCFPDGNVASIQADAAEARLLANVRQSVSFTEGNLVINATDVPQSENRAKLTIQTSDLIVIPSSTRQTSTNFVPVVDNSNNRIGSVVGSGVRATRAIRTQMCIRRNRNMRVGNSAHIVPRFVTESNGRYVVADVAIVANRTTDICGIVSDNRFYFPAMIANNAPVPPAPPAPVPPTPAPSRRASDASGVIASLAVILLSACLLLLAMA